MLSYLFTNLTSSSVLTFCVPQDFHEMSHGLLLWLENIDRRRNEIVPIDPIQDSDTLHEHHKTLTVQNSKKLLFKHVTLGLHLHILIRFTSYTRQQIRQELLDSQLKVASLQDMSLQLLVNSQGSDCLEAKEKVHVIGNRLKLLLKEVTRDLRELSRTLDITSSQQVDQLIQLPAKLFTFYFTTGDFRGVLLAFYPSDHYQLVHKFVVQGKCWMGDTLSTSKHPVCSICVFAHSSFQKS